MSTIESTDKKHKGFVFQKSYHSSVFCIKKSTSESFSIKKFVGSLISQFNIKNILSRVAGAHFYGHFDRMIAPRRFN